MFRANSSMAKSEKAYPAINVFLFSHFYHLPDLWIFAWEYFQLAFEQSGSKEQAVDWSPQWSPRQTGSTPPNWVKASEDPMEASSTAEIKSTLIMAAESPLKSEMEPVIWSPVLSINKLIKNAGLSQYTQGSNWMYCALGLPKNLV